MSPAGTTLLESALALPEQERLAIADALLSSLPEESPELDDASFAEELQRRSDEMEKDPSACVPWAEVKKHL